MEVLIRHTAYCLENKYTFGVHYLSNGVSLVFTLCFTALRVYKNLWLSLIEQEKPGIIRFVFSDGV